MQNCCSNGKIVYRKETGATSCDVTNNEIQKRRRRTVQIRGNSVEKICARTGVSLVVLRALNVHIFFCLFFRKVANTPIYIFVICI